MKNSLFSLSLILIIIHANSFPYAAADEYSVVVDSQGNELEPLASYYIRHAGIGFVGGIGLPKGSEEVCPAHVIQMPSEVDPGIPVRLQRVNPTDPILENTDIFITFRGAVTGCPLGGAYWRIKNDLADGKSFVVAGTVQPGPATPFRIFPTDESGVYIFGLCPPIYPIFECLDIGLERVSEERRLTVVHQNSNAKYRFQFVKAELQQSAAQVK